jgi:hypothetical protein
MRGDRKIGAERFRHIQKANSHVGFKKKIWRLSESHKLAEKQKSEGCESHIGFCLKSLIETLIIPEQVLTYLLFLPFPRSLFSFSFLPPPSVVFLAPSCKLVAGIQYQTNTLLASNDSHIV